MDQCIADIIDRAQEGTPPSYDEILILLALEEASPEATAVRGAANDVVRSKTGNAAVIWGQIGIDVHPCEADCQFCSFAESTTGFKDRITMPVDEVVRRAREFAQGGDLYGLYLMCMNSYDEEYYLDVVTQVRIALPESTLLYSNIGDTDVEYFKRLKEAGLDGAYHVKRLGEGVYTKLSPARREQTISAAREAGLFVKDCCEPIGAETPDEEVAKRLLEIQSRGYDIGSPGGTGVMKRSGVPGTQFDGLASEISNLRLALVGAVQAFVMVDQLDMPWLAMHEPNLIGLVSGCNSITAEAGFNPRDTEGDTIGHHGIDVPAAREMFYQAGFSTLVRGDGMRLSLTPEYMEARLRHD